MKQLPEGAAQATLRRCPQVLALIEKLVAAAILPNAEESLQSALRAEKLSSVMSASQIAEGKKAAQDIVNLVWSAARIEAAKTPGLDVVERMQ